MTAEIIVSCEGYGEKIWGTYQELRTWKGYVCFDIQYCADHRDSAWWSTDSSRSGMLGVKSEIESYWGTFESNFTYSNHGLMYWLDRLLYNDGGTHCGQPGQSDALQGASDTWGTVAGTLHDLLAGAPPDDEFWEGEAADSYRANVGPQASAVCAVADAAKKLSAQYSALADCISSLWSKIEPELRGLSEALDGYLGEIQDSCRGSGHNSDHTWAGSGFEIKCWDQPVISFSHAAEALTQTVGTYSDSSVGIFDYISDASSTIDEIKASIRQFVASGELPSAWPGLGAA